MIVCTADALDSVARWASPDLVSPASFARVKTLAAQLPCAFSDGALECRLGEDPRVDLLVALIAGERGGGALLAQHGRGQLSHLCGNPGWARVLRFCEEWIDPASSFHDGVPFLWLEFDIDGSAPHPSPYPFPCVDRTLAPGGTRAGRDDDARRRPRGVVWRALHILFGRPLSSPVDRALRWCIASMSASARLLHVAPLVVRGLDAARIVVDMAADDLADYLRQVGWPGEVGEIEAIVDRVQARASRVAIHLDVSESVAPTLGLEVVDGPRIPHTLDWLVERGACSPRKRDAILAWRGSSQSLLPGHQWPSVLHRVLLLKLVCTAGVPTQAKAYLGYSHHFTMFPRLQETETASRDSGCRRDRAGS